MQSFRKKRSLAVTVFLILGLVAAVVLVQKTQLLRRFAAGSTVNITLAPSSSSVSSGDEFNVGVTMSPGTNKVSAIELKLEYNPTLLTPLLDKTQTGEVLPLTLIPATVETVAANKSILTLVSGANCDAQGCYPAAVTGRLATFTFKAGSTAGTSPIAVSPLTKIASALDTSLASTGLDVGVSQAAISVTVPNPTVNPTATAVATPRPSVTPIATVVPTPTVIPGGNVVIRPLEDTTVKQAYSNKNYGSESSLITSSYDSSNNQIAYLKFDMRNVSGTISKAQLKLTPSLSRSVAKSVNQVGTSWSESTMNWGNRATVGSSLGEFSGSVTKDQPIYINLSTSAVSSSVGSIFGIAVTNNSGSANTLEFYSREASNYKPELVLQTVSTVAATTLTAREDSYVQSNSSRVNNNYGDQTALVSSSFDTSNYKTAFLKFGDTQLIGKTIDSAKLMITPSLARSTEKEVRSVSASWSESSITYNNQPSIGSLVGTINAMETPTIVGKTLTVTLSPDLLQVDADGNISIAVTNKQTNNTLEFYSREYSTVGYRPTLVVQYH